MRKRLWYALSALLLVAIVGVLLARLAFHLFTGTLACHTWRSMVPLQPNENTQFTSVALLSATDVWLAGTNFAPATHVSRPLVEHWDGQHWQTLFPPNPGSFDVMIRSITAVSDSDVWVVGGAYTSPGTGTATPGTCCPRPSLAVSPNSMA
ncbi:MAG: hypothetical protein M3Y81_20450 [Chloroflexota bacterium]|nr:hypothetical protein [Chloroflexota bacterium]